MNIDGKKIAEKILAGLAEEVEKLPKPPRLAAVLVGNIGGSRRFLKLKQKAAEKIGVDYKIHELPESIAAAQLREKVAAIAEDEAVDGIIVELPLPAQINAQDILDAASENKDVDVLSKKSQETFFVRCSPILPPAVEAVKIIFEKNSINVKGKKCAVFGQGLLVGRPINHWLVQEGAIVEAIGEFTQNPREISQNADIVISGVGKPNLIKDYMVKEGAIVIDFGYENVSGRSVGDVDFEAVSKKASLITPVPGGVGPLVIAAVFKNLITLVKLKNA